MKSDDLRRLAEALPKAKAIRHAIARQDPSMVRRVALEERAALALADLDPGGERHFVCIEAAVVQEPVTLGPRRRWTGTQTLTAS